MYGYVEEDHGDERIAIIPFIYGDFAPVGCVGHDVGEAVDQAVEEDGRQFVENF